MKIIVLELTPAVFKAQFLVRLSFNSTFQLIKRFSTNLQKLRRYFNGIAIATFFEILFASAASVSFNNLALYSKDLKLKSIAISSLNLFDSFFD